MPLKHWAFGPHGEGLHKSFVAGSFSKQLLQEIRREKDVFV